MISMVLATYNEKDTIPTLIRSLLAEAPEEMEIIVVDDDSPDQTWRVVESLDLPNVRVIRRKARGLASAYNRGIIESRGDYIGWMDADMGMPPSLIRQMHRMIVDEGYDIVIGSRYAPGGADDREDRLRTVASRLINGLARLVLRYPIGDWVSNYVLMKRSVLDSVTFPARGYGDYCIEFVYDVRRKGLKLAEIGYRFRERTAGESKSAPSLLKFLWAGVKYGVRIFVVRFKKTD